MNHVARPFREVPLLRCVCGASLFPGVSSEGRVTCRKVAMQYHMRKIVLHICVLGKFEQMWVTGKLIGKQLSAQRAHTWWWWFTASLCRLLSGCRPDHVCVFLKRCSCLHFDLVQIIGCKSAWLQFSLVSFHFLRRQKLASPDVVMVCPHSHRDPTT